ncbi:MAG: hypothetical protein MI742_11460 [Desulfobacterales bacterium]|nr:hypothetical protein [Desulfobacterales bacterium]
MGFIAALLVSGFGFGLFVCLVKKYCLFQKLSKKNVAEFEVKVNGFAGETPDRVINRSFQGIEMVWKGGVGGAFKADIIGDVCR